MHIRHVFGSINFWARPLALFVRLACRVIKRSQKHTVWLHREKEARSKSSVRSFIKWSLTPAQILCLLRKKKKKKRCRFQQKRWCHFVQVSPEVKGLLWRLPERELCLCWVEAEGSLATVCRWTASQSRDKPATGTVQGFKSCSSSHWTCRTSLSFRPKRVLYLSKRLSRDRRYMPWYRSTIASVGFSIFGTVIGSPTKIKNNYDKILLKNTDFLLFNFFSSIAQKRYV